MVRAHSGPPLFLNRDGGLAQLGERLPCKQEVSGSIPLISTILKLNRSIQEIECFDLVSKETGTDCTLKTEQCIMKVISKATERSVS